MLSGCCEQTELCELTQIRALWHMLQPSQRHQCSDPAAEIQRGGKKQEQTGEILRQKCEKIARLSSVTSEDWDSDDSERQEPAWWCIHSTPTWSSSWCQSSCACRGCCSLPWPTDPRRFLRSGGSGQRGSINQVSFMHYTDDLENKYAATFFNQWDCVSYALI